MFQISADALHLPLITADPKLLRVLRPYCDAAAKERNVKPGTLRSAVEAEVEKLLPDGKAKAENVAEALALSLRTLARRLADEGTTYGEVVDQLRKSLATQYLKDPGMSLGQIAWLLGYEGSTSFNHAFKRWTGRSPSADRNSGVAGVTPISWREKTEDWQALTTCAEQQPLSCLPTAGDFAVARRQRSLEIELNDQERRAVGRLLTERKARPDRNHGRHDPT